MPLSCGLFYFLLRRLSPFTAMLYALAVGTPLRSSVAQVGSSRRSRPPPYIKRHEGREYGRKRAVYAAHTPEARRAAEFSRAVPATPAGIRSP